jgi:hypothetical protein
VFGRWLTLVRGLVGSQRLGDQRVPFGPSDEVVIKTALQDLTGYSHGHTHLQEVTIPQLWQLLDNPTPDLIAACRYQSARHFLDETRLLRDALGQLVSGALAGLFDGPTTIDVDWRAPIQSLSLSRLEPLGDEALGMALLCLNSWGRGMRGLADRGDVRIVGPRRILEAAAARRRSRQKLGGSLWSRRPKLRYPGRSHRLRQEGLLPQRTDGLTVDTRSEEVTSVTHSNLSAPDVSLRLGVAAVAGRWRGDRRGSCYRAPRWRRGGRSNAAEGRAGSHRGGS